MEVHPSLVIHRGLAMLGSGNLGEPPDGKIYESYMTYDEDQYALPTNIKYGLMILNEYHGFGNCCTLTIQEGLHITTGEDLQFWKDGPLLNMVATGNGLVATYMSTEKVTLELQLDSEKDRDLVMKGVINCLYQWEQTILAQKSEVMPIDYETMTTEAERRACLLGLEPGIIIGDEVKEMSPRLKALVAMLQIKTDSAIKIDSGWLRWRHDSAMTWRTNGDFDMVENEHSYSVTLGTGETFTVENNFGVILGEIKHECKSHDAWISDYIREAGLTLSIGEVGSTLNLCGLLSNYILLTTGNYLLASLMMSYEELNSMDYKIPDGASGNISKAIAMTIRENRKLVRPFVQKGYDKRCHRNKGRLSRTILLESIAFTVG